MSITGATSNAYIVDASFILQALLSQHEVVITRFLHLMSKNSTTQVMAPDLLKIEVRNGLRFSITNIELTQEIISNFSQLPIQYLDTPDFLLDQAIIMSQKYQTTVYDSLYHALALQQDATFITCDKKYYQAAKELGNIELVP